jgi:hypothetical protein
VVHGAHAAGHAQVLPRRIHLERHHAERQLGRTPLRAGVRELVARVEDALLRRERGDRQLGRLGAPGDARDRQVAVAQRGGGRRVGPREQAAVHDEARLDRERAAVDLEHAVAREQRLARAAVGAERRPRGLLVEEVAGIRAARRRARLRAEEVVGGRRRLGRRDGGEHRQRDRNEEPRHSRSPVVTMPCR